jgi:hypothetical protein
MSEDVNGADRDDRAEQWCILLPCAAGERWAVPQNALAEIVTLHGDAAQPPEELAWRGVTVPVVDFGQEGEAPWLAGGSGLVAVFLGLAGGGCDYWGVALRGEGIAARRIDPAEVVDAPDDIADHATAAFILDGATCQVPDLAAIQRQIAARRNAA